MMEKLPSLILVLLLSLALAPACNGDDENNSANNGDTADATDGSDDAEADADADPGPQTIDYDHAFTDGEDGWESDVADFRIGNDSAVAFRGELRSLPGELNEAGSGYFLDAKNPSASVFPFLRKELTAEDGIVANAQYNVTWRIRFATNLATDCPSNPGTEIYLKAGATKYKPAVIERDDMNVLNYEKGEGQVGGPAATTLGDVAHDGDCSGLDRDDYFPQVLEGTHSTTVDANEDGGLWLLTGVEVDVSESISIYIIRLEVTVEPVQPE
jgi:hypothetical protein